MTQEEALNILAQVALKAQSVGALKLEESVLVKEAIDTFTPKKELDADNESPTKVKNLKPKVD